MIFLCAKKHDGRALLSVNGLAVLVLGITPQPLLVLCIEAVRASI